MPFSEALKLRIKERSFFQCCVCKAIGVELHHVIPEAQGGPDSEDNAAPLCPSCHEMLGANPEKRKFIRECRDHWFKICVKRFPDHAEQLKILSEQMATKDDIKRLSDMISSLMAQPTTQDQDPYQLREFQLTSGAIASTIIGMNPYFTPCKYCGKLMGATPGSLCPACFRESNPVA